MTRPRPARPITLRLESLEDRSVPATFNVTTTLDVVDPLDGKRSLREAITAANNLAGADLIVLPAGIYKLALAGAGEDANATGDLDITGAVTLRGAGAGATIIDGQQLDRAFDVAGTSPSSIKVVLEKLTVRNGNVTGNGGGIQVVNADLVVRDAIITGNRSSLSGGGLANQAVGTVVKVVRTTVSRNVAGTSGGGLDVPGTSFHTITDSTIRRNVASGVGGGINGGNVSLTGCTINDNFADGEGGGIRVFEATLTNCTITGNRAVAGGGGGLIGLNALTLTNCTVSRNSTVFGGDGGGIRTSTATLTNCTVSDNVSDGSGGGVFAGIATLTRSTFSGNSAKRAGGGILAPGTATLTNCTISGNSAGNSADDTGGGLFANSGTLLNCTIVENFANTGGGVFHGSSGTLNVRNTIIALNLVEFIETGPDVSGDFTSQGHNLIGDGSGSTGFGVNFDIVGTSANPIDPKLGPLALNGGKTKTHALLAGSPAIDRGDNANLPLTDQRGAGFPRKKDGNGDGVAVVDIGAFER